MEVVGEDMKRALEYVEWLRNLFGTRQRSGSRDRSMYEPTTREGAIQNTKQSKG